MLWLVGMLSTGWFDSTRDNFEEWVRIINDLPDSVWYLVIIVFTATFSTKMTDKVLNRNKKQYHVQMDKLKVDAVITDLELQLETHNNPYGSFVNFRFIDTFPYFTKVNEMVEEVKKRNDVDLINYEYSYTGIHEDTDIKHFDITRN